MLETKHPGFLSPEGEMKFEFEPPTTTRSYLDMSREIFEYLQYPNRMISENELAFYVSKFPYIQGINPERLESIFFDLERSPEQSEQRLAEFDFSIDQVDDTYLFAMANYATSRLPQELLCNDCDIVMDTRYIQSRNKFKRVPQKRKRGYFVDQGEDGKKLITLEIRTVTDLYETISCLGILSLFRGRVRSIINDVVTNGPPIYPYVSESISDVVAGFENIDIINFCNSSFNLVNSVGKIPSINKMSHKGREESEHARAFVHMAIERLDKAQFVDPHVIFFSNTFTYLQVMAQSLLTREIPLSNGRSVTIYEYMTGEIGKLLKVNRMDPLKFSDYLEVVYNKSIDKNTKRMSKKSVLVRLLQDDDIVNSILINNLQTPPQVIKALRDFKTYVNSAEFMRDIGLETLLNANESPTSEPLYRIDTSLIDPVITENLDPFIKNEIDKLINEKLKIFVLPYALGELSGFILKYFHESINIRGVMEMGKIGHLLPKPNYDVVGKTVQTPYVGRMGNGGLKRVYPQPEGYNPSVVTLEAPSVLLQTPWDMLQGYILARNLQSENQINGIYPVYLHAITVGMEHYSLYRMAQRLRLPTVFLDYISDVVLGGDRISVGGLGARGIPCTMEAFVKATRFMGEIGDIINSPNNIRVGEILNDNVPRVRKAPKVPPQILLDGDDIHEMMRQLEDRGLGKRRRRHRRGCN